jgi:hypothetical protein
MKHRESKTMAFVMPPRLLEAFNRRRADRNLSASEAVREAVGEWVGRPDLADCQQGRPPLET